MMFEPSILELDECRAAFVDVMTRKNEEAPVGKKRTLRPHWKGPAHGFASSLVQRSYEDFKIVWFIDEFIEELSVVLQGSEE